MLHIALATMMKLHSHESYGDACRWGTHDAGSDASGWGGDVNVMVVRVVEGRGGLSWEGFTMLSEQLHCTRDRKLSFRRN